MTFFPGWQMRCWLLLPSSPLGYWCWRLFGVVALTLHPLLPWHTGLRISRIILALDIPGLHLLLMVLNFATPLLVRSSFKKQNRKYVAVGG